MAELKHHFDENQENFLNQMLWDEYITSKSNQEPLWAALKSGIIQTVATDHCPFHQHKQKELGRADFRKIPNGAAGIQNRLALMYTFGVLEGRMDLHQFVEVNWRLYGRQAAR